MVGTLMLHLPPGSGLVSGVPLEVAYDVNAAVDRKLDLSGTYEGVFGSRTPVRSATEGVTETGAALRKRYAIAPAHDYPTWIGPYGNFSPGSCGHGSWMTCPKHGCSGRVNIRRRRAAIRSAMAT